MDRAFSRLITAMMCSAGASVSAARPASVA
jgi:hypothetical protein